MPVPTFVSPPVVPVRLPPNEVLELLKPVDNVLVAIPIVLTFTMRPRTCSGNGIRLVCRSPGRVAGGLISGRSITSRYSRRAALAGSQSRQSPGFIPGVLAALCVPEPAQGLTCCSKPGARAHTHAAATLACVGQGRA